MDQAFRSRRYGPWQHLSAGNCHLYLVQRPSLIEALPEEERARGVLLRCSSRAWSNASSDDWHRSLALLTVLVCRGQLSWRRSRLSPLAYEVLGPVSGTSLGVLVGEGSPGARRRCGLVRQKSLFPPVSMPRLARVTDRVLVEPEQGRTLS